VYINSNAILELEEYHGSAKKIFLLKVKKLHVEEIIRPKVYKMVRQPKKVFLQD
jgi:hypothetical protein